MATIWEYRSSPHFTDAERAAFDFALAAACVPNAVTPEIQQALRDHWSDDEIVEITGVIALFGFLNRWNDSMATTLEDIGVDAGRRNLAASGRAPENHGGRPFRGGPTLGAWHATETIRYAGRVSAIV